jgi:hypothetical protein
LITFFFIQNPPFWTTIEEIIQKIIIKISYWWIKSSKIHNVYFQWFYSSTKKIMKIWMILSIWHRGSKVWTHVVLNFIREWPLGGSRGPWTFSSRGQGRSPLKYINCRLCIGLERKVCLLEKKLDFHKYCG